jgi:hypothetical protein
MIHNDTSKLTPTRIDEKIGFNWTLEPRYVNIAQDHDSQWHLKVNYYKDWLQNWF